MKNNIAQHFFLDETSFARPERFLHSLTEIINSLHYRWCLSHTPCMWRDRYYSHIPTSTARTTMSPIKTTTTKSHIVARVPLSAGIHRGEAARPFEAPTSLLHSTPRDPPRLKVGDGKRPPLPVPLRPQRPPRGQTAEELAASTPRYYIRISTNPPKCTSDT